MKKQLLIISLLTSILKLLMADGLIIIDPPPRPISTPFPLQVQSHHVEININDLKAETLIDQVFYNPGPFQLQGYYLFPIPENAVINRFSMFINGKETPAELLDAEKARQIYEDIVRSQSDPALLEYEGQALYKVRIYPIEPYSKKRVKISYQEILSRDKQTVRYLYPLNTEKFSAKPLSHVSIKTRIKSRQKINTIYSTSHHIEIEQESDYHAVIRYEEKNVKPDTDFKLYFSTDQSDLGFSLLTEAEKKDSGFFFLNISPALNFKPEKTISKSITFVLDSSGSMQGKKLVQARKALLFCIKQLNPGDHFEVIRFSTAATALFQQLKPANKKHLQEATAFIRQFSALGGTNIEEALNLALKNTPPADSPHFILLITDGKPTIGQTHENKLIQGLSPKKLKQTRIFTFGIGHAVNTHLLDKISRLSRAFRTYISPDEDIETNITRFFEKLQFPILTHLKLISKGEVQLSQIYPRHLPDLFVNTSLNLLGRYQGSGTLRLILEGQINQKKQSFQYELILPDPGLEDQAVATLWAARRIGFLLDQIRLNGEERELIEEIIFLSRRHGIITPYTSYLILEDEIQRQSRQQLDQRFRIVRPILEESYNQAKTEYQKMHKKSGADSVQSSRELQALNRAANIKQAQPGQTGPGDQDEKTKSRIFTQKIKKIQGRAFYQTGQFWIDSRLQEIKKMPVIRIQFQSAKYFELLKKEKKISPFLALGKNIRFIFKNLIYEIYE